MENSHSRRQSGYCIMYRSVRLIPVINAPVVDVRIFEGPGVVHLLQPTRSAMCNDYAKDKFLPYL